MSKPKIIRFTTPNEQALRFWDDQPALPPLDAETVDQTNRQILAVALVKGACLVATNAKQQT